MASELRITTLANNAGTESVDTAYVINGTLKQWIHYDGTGTVSTRESLNVSGLVDNGTGSYTVNLSNSMNTKNYAQVTNGGRGNDQHICTNQPNNTTDSLKVYSVDWTTQSFEDTNTICAGVLGDLA